MAYKKKLKIKSRKRQLTEVLELSNQERIHRKERLQVLGSIGSGHQFGGLKKNLEKGTSEARLSFYKVDTAPEISLNE